MEWNDLIRQEYSKDYFKNLRTFVMQRRKEAIVYPQKADLFKAFDLSPYDDIKVVILGQDPYHQKNQAMGLSFSVPYNQTVPKSLINIYKELDDDLGIKNTHGDLTQWAKQGVFLLNTLLTVEEGQPLSHKDKGWERFTDTVISALSQRQDPIIFVLWGKKAQEKKPLLAPQHAVIASSHPSPLGAHYGFIGSHPFSKINQQLEAWGKTPIDWQV